MKTLMPDEEIIKAWKISQTTASIGFAKECFKKIKCLDEYSLECRAFFNSAITAYAKPFTKNQITKNKRSTLFDESKIPQELNEVHKTLYSMRDKVVGHIDGNAEDENLNFMNSLHVTINPDKSFNFEAGYPTIIKEPYLTKSIELCDNLLIQCQILMSGIVFFNDLKNKFKNIEPGEYYLKTTSDSTPKT